MSYYILPKKHIKVEINPTLSKIPIELNPVISQSIISYLSEIEISISNLSVIEYSIDFIRKIANPYEFIFSKVPGSKFSVSKLKPYSNTFYILYELFNTFILFETMMHKNITSIHYGPNSTASIECLSMLREDKEDTNYAIPEIILHNTSNNYVRNHDGINCLNSSIDFFYFEINSNNSVNTYIIDFIVVLCNILSCQKAQGTCIIKVNSIFYKPILDILFILTGVYDKIYITKPNTSDISKNDRYIVCKHFIHNSSKIQEYNNYLVALTNILHDNDNDNDTDNDNKSIYSLIKYELPYYFLNKVEDSNIIIAHQQIEFMDQIICIIKHKNRIDKLEALKKSNIQKCIQWCEKFKIPNNKFVDKVNIFLPIVIYDEQHLLDEDAVIKLDDYYDNNDSKIQL
jgi:hypothetical protein